MEKVDFTKPICAGYNPKQKYEYVKKDERCGEFCHVVRAISSVEGRNVFRVVNVNAFGYDVEGNRIVKNLGDRSRKKAVDLRTRVKELESQLLALSIRVGTLEAAARGYTIVSGDSLDGDGFTN